MRNVDRISDDINGSLSEIVSKYGGSMVTKWVTLVEVINEDGTKSFWSMTSPDLSTWDRIGMVEFHNRMAQPDPEGAGDIDGQ